MPLNKNISLEIKSLQRQIMSLTNYDEDLVSRIVEYTLLLGKGKGIYMETIYNLIMAKYPDYKYHQEFEEKGDLKMCVYQLAKIVTMRHEAVVEVSKKDLLTKSRSYYIQLREAIEEEIIKIFYPGDIINDSEMMEIIPEPAIIGDLTEYIDSIEL